MRKGETVKIAGFTIQAFFNTDLIMIYIEKYGKLYSGSLDIVEETGLIEGSHWYDSFLVPKQVIQHAKEMSQ